MQNLQSFAAGVIAETIRRQPASPARTAFAWSVAVGPALSRVTTVELDHRVLRVTTGDPRWGREVRRASQTILERLRLLLGDEAIVEIVVE